MTFPRTKEQDRAYVKQMFESLTDMTDYFEEKTPQELDKDANAAREKWIKKEIKKVGPGQQIQLPPDEAFYPTDRDQLKFVVKYDMSSLEVELLAWEILVRCRQPYLYQKETNNDYFFHSCQLRSLKRGPRLYRNGLGRGMPPSRLSRPSGQGGEPSVSQLRLIPPLWVTSPASRSESGDGVGLQVSTDLQDNYPFTNTSGLGSAHHEQAKL